MSSTLPSPLENPSRLAWEVEQLRAVAQLVVNEPDMGELTKRLAEKTAELFCADQTLIGLAHDNQIVMKEVYEAETFHPAEFALKPGRKLPRG